MRLLVLVLLAACGGASTPPPKSAPQADACERTMTRSRNVLPRPNDGGADGSDDARWAQVIENCRATQNEPDMVALMNCIDGASDSPAVVMCWAKLSDPLEHEDDPVDPRSQAERHLTNLSKNVKVAYLTNAVLPPGKVGPTPPKCGCGTACPFDMDQWQDPIWTELDFLPTEDNGLYVYAYESDGKTFTATATGDPDCDGRAEVWVLTGAITPDGNGIATQLKRP